MKDQTIDGKKLREILAVKDLSDPVNGIHAINLIIRRVEQCLLEKHGWPKPEIKRDSPFSTVRNEFDRLHFPFNSPNRSPVYTRYVDQATVLRTHTSSMIPDLLIEMRKKNLIDYLVLCPGICYRRDVIDRKHTGTPHQMDIWRVKKGDPRLERSSLIELTETVLYCLIPEIEYRANEVKHPYTINGLEIEIMTKDGWLEILECGEVHPEILRDAGLNPKDYSGLAMGLGLDRLVMITKKIDDIRLLRSDDPRIAQQMKDLEPYRQVSKYPCIKRDISISVPESCTEEDICEEIRDVLGLDFEIVEEITIVAITPYNQLPSQAIERLGIKLGQKNLLIRITFRSHKRSLNHREVNELRDQIYRVIHKGGRGYVL